MEGENTFYSGPGSHNKDAYDKYIDQITEFLLSFPKKPNVLDLGCGDFFIGPKLRECCGKYIACDIVDELINFNKVKYKNLNVDFRVLDITEDELPKADIVFIRQVLQHLSNNDIKKIIPKLINKYKYLILTEHLPNNDNFVPNADKVSSSGVRVDYNSGVVLTDSPFNLKVKSSKLICITNDRKERAVNGRIVTILYKLI